VALMVDVHAWSDSSESANYTQYQIASRNPENEGETQRPGSVVNRG
jgi:hypothetical protein